MNALKYLLLLTAISFLSSASAAATIKQREVISGNTRELWIIVRGTIIQGDTVDLLSAIGDKDDRVVTVWLESSGGNVAEGLAMARIIKALKLNTYVHTDGKCDSICSIMFLSGKRKMATESSRIGIHAAYDLKTKRPDIYSNTVIGWYLGSLDYPQELVDLWVRTKPDRLIDINDGPNKDLGLGIETVKPVDRPLLDLLFD